MMIPLKQLREDRRMTQLDLSKALNISPSAVGMWEQGRRLPDYENLKRISKIFGVTTDYLLDNEENVKKPEDYLADDEKKLVRNYRWLDEDGKNIILSVIGRFNGKRVTETSKMSTVKTNSENGSNYGVVGGNFNSTVNLR